VRPLEEIERDLAKLPPSPWTTEDHPVKTSSHDSPWTEVRDADGHIVVDTSNSDHSVEEEDGKLHDTGAATCERIARLRSDAKDLVTEVKRLRALLIRARRFVGMIGYTAAEEADTGEVDALCIDIDTALGAQS
jgi:hypothetical protein